MARALQDYNAPAPGQNTFGSTPVEDWSADPWTVPPAQQQQQQQQQQDWQADVSLSFIDQFNFDCKIFQEDLL